jgi:hypothetical protein
MIKSINILILTLIICSCSKSDKTKTLKVDSLEITYYNGWTGGSTHFINKAGIAKIGLYHIINKIDSVENFIDTLNIQEIDSINYYLNSIKNVKIDSIYDGHCQDCGAYLIKIILTDTTINSLIIGTEENNNLLTKLARLVTAIKPRPEQHVDSCFYFSTTKFMIPPPPPENYHKFVPPKDSIILP